MKFVCKLVQCALLILFAVSVASAQAQTQVVVPKTPTSGAVLSITGILGSNPGTPVSVLIYDSQIHSGSVGQVPVSAPCTSADAAVRTDAYVLQGGSPTGCSPADVYEITDAATSIATFVPRTDNNLHQLPGSVDISGFNISTHFVCVGKCVKNTVTGYKTFCNTALTFCINVLNGNPADSGFVVIKNNNTQNFTGTITVKGTSTTCGAASDSATSLPGGASVTLALGQPGTAAAPGTSDSSNCGGFNFDQVSLPMASPTQVTTFIFGSDKFTVTPSNINLGDVLTFRPVPMPASLFNLPGSTLSNGQQCVSISDFAAPTGANVANPVCVEFQTHCLKNGATCSDAESFYWIGELDGRLDQNAGYPKDPSTGLAEIGGVHFLGAPGVDCPQNAFSEDIVLSYIGDTPNDLPLRSGGGGLNCFVSTFVPTAPVVASGVEVKAFDGFFSPNKPLPTINPINSGQNVSLPFFFADGAGGPGVTNLSWCPGGPSLADPTVCSHAGVQKPWVAFLRTALPGCTNSTSGFIGTSPTNSFMQNLGAGNNKFNFATDSTEPTTNNCFNIGVVFSNGLSVPAVNSFAFTK